MEIMEIKVQTLNKKAFEPFGDIIGKQDDKPTLSDDDFAYWPGLSDIQLTNNIGQLSVLELKRPRPFVCEKLECHLYCSEAIIPLEGQSIGIFGLSKNSNEDDFQIDLNSIKAFIFDGTKGVNIKKGVWHWLPYPLSEKVYLVVILAKETHNNDLQIVDLREKYNLSIKLNL